MPLELFVGGPADGQRINVPSEAQYYQVRSKRKFRAPSQTYDRPDIVLYRRESIGVGRSRSRFGVFLSEDLFAMQMIRHLIDGYKPNPSVDPVELAAAADLCDSHGLMGVAEFLKRQLSPLESRR